MRALYAFCFAPASLDLSADLGLDTCGWEDPVYASPIAGLNAVQCEVPRERFAGAEAEQRLADLE